MTAAIDDRVRPDAAGDPALEVVKICRSFGGLRAVDGISFSVYPGQIVGLIGPNGAGKTTTINLISGLLAISEGRVHIAGRDATTASAPDIARLGLARTFQTSRLFDDLTVEQNVELARLFAARTVDGRQLQRVTRRSLGRWLGLADHDARDDVTVLLERLDLVSVRTSPAAMLSYGHQRRLEIARALALSPAILLLDEPVAGMNDREAQDIGELLGSLAADGLAVLVVEHNMRFVVDTAQHIEVLDHGRSIASGTPARVLSRPDVIEAYLGTSHAER